MPDTIFCAALLAAAPALAGRPFTTEDASVLEDKACQVEAWADRSRDATAAWFVPACNFGGGIEWQAGFARTRAEGDARFSEAYAQAKALFREAREGSPWGAGIVLGVVKRPLNEARPGWDNPYALLPFSFGIGEATVHVQPGWARDRERRRDATVWGVAAEGPASERITLLAEAFGENAQRPFLRVGMRWVAIKDRLELDLSWVARPGGMREERYASAGLTWQGGAFLP